MICTGRKTSCSLCGWQREEMRIGLVAQRGKTGHGEVRVHPCDPRSWIWKGKSLYSFFMHGTFSSTNLDQCQARGGNQKVQPGSLFPSFRLHSRTRSLGRLCGPSPWSHVHSHGAPTWRITSTGMLKCTSWSDKMLDTGLASETTVPSLLLLPQDTLGAHPSERSPEAKTGIAVAQQPQELLSPIATVFPKPHSKWVAFCATQGCFCLMLSDFHPAARWTFIW